MRKGTSCAFLSWLILATSSFAQQTPEVPPATELPVPAAAEQTPNFFSADDSCCKTYRFWFRGEYLLWWVKDTPVPVPLVTAGNPAVGFPTNTAGAIGQPGTQVLFGNSDQGLGTFSGMRFTAGCWLDADRTLGFEGTGFLLERRTSGFAAASNAAGNPPLYYPIFSGIANAERGIPIADPLRGFAGNVAIDSSLRLWGAEANTYFIAARQPGRELSWLVGFRYMDLQERLHNFNSTTDLIFNNTEVLNDVFATRNQFYGGQLGARLSLERDRFTLDVTGKVAVGVTHQSVDVQGNITQLGPNFLVPPGPGTFPGGLFAQRSNIGRSTEDEFGVIPSVELKLGYKFTERLRGFVGYDVLYWNQVVRPGNQIDHRVNLSQNAVLDPAGTGTLVGPATPARQFQRSDFWAQGVSFGLEFRY